MLEEPPPPTSPPKPFDTSRPLPTLGEKGEALKEELATIRALVASVAAAHAGAHAPAVA